MTYRRLTTAGLLLALLFAASMILGDSPRTPTLETIGNEVQCTCGCVTSLNQCPMLECAEKSQTRAFIQREIAAGKDEPAILADLSARFGVQILSAPPAQGFNLAVWILPSVGLLMGLATAIVIARRWRRKPATVVRASSAPLDPKVLSAMDDEMKSVGMK